MITVLTRFTVVKRFRRVISPLSAGTVEVEEFVLYGAGKWHQSINFFSH